MHYDYLGDTGRIGADDFEILAEVTHFWVEIHLNTLKDNSACTRTPNKSSEHVCCAIAGKTGCI